MMRLPQLALSLLLSGFVLNPVSAQNLQLDVVGGAMPGPLELEVYPGLQFFELVLIVPSTTSGPTPVQSFDPMDPRQLSIGLDLVGNAWGVLTDLTGSGVVQTQLAASPALLDVPLFFQAVTFQFVPRLLDRISNGNVIRLANADSFRDRLVFMIRERAFGTALVRPDRRTMVLGGARGQLLAQVATNTTDVYDPMTDSVSSGPTMSTPRSMHTMTELSSGLYLVCGGVDAANNPQGSCEIYDPVSDTFAPAASMGTPRMAHTATLLADGRVFVTGGLEALSVMPSQLSAIRDAVASTEIYDPVADTWTPGPSLSDPRAAHFALQRPDGVIVLGGGISWDPNILFGWVPAVRSSTDLYDPVTNSMVVGPAMGSARALTDPVELSPGRWLVAGGMSGLSLIPFNAGNPTAAAEIYDTASNSWVSVGAMATARANHKSWPLGNGRYLLVGGGDGSILSPTPLATTEIFDEANNSFTPGPIMNSARAGAGVIATPQGQVMIYGGADASGSVTTSTEWYYF